MTRREHIPYPTITAQAAAVVEAAVEWAEELGEEELARSYRQAEPLEVRAEAVGLALHLLEGFIKDPIEAVKIISQYQAPALGYALTRYRIGNRLGAAEELFDAWIEARRAAKEPVLSR